MIATTEELPNSLVYEGSADTIDDAVQQIILKLLADSSWRVLLPPYPIYKHDMLDTGGSLVQMTGIGFMLHKFPVMCEVINPPQSDEIIPPDSV